MAELRHSPSVRFLLAVGQIPTHSVQKLQFPRLEELCELSIAFDLAFDRSILAHPPHLLSFRAWLNIVRPAILAARSQEADAFPSFSESSSFRPSPKASVLTARFADRGTSLGSTRPASKRSTRTPSAKSIPACALSLQSISSISQDTLQGHFEPVAKL